MREAWKLIGGVVAVVLVGLAWNGSAKADVVTLVNGDTLSGTIIAQDDTSVTMSHAILGEVTLPREQVAAVMLTGAETAEAEEVAEETAEAQENPPATVVTPEQLEQRIENPGLFGTDFMLGWNKRLELGVSGRSGNTETFDFILRAQAQFEDDVKRWLLETSYYFGTDDGETSENDFRLGARRDWLLAKGPWFYFAEGKYRYDEFEPWDHRASFYGGAGRTLIENDDYTLRSRLGAGLIAELGGEQDDEYKPEGLIGVEFAWKIKEGHSFGVVNDFYPRLDDLGEFRNVTSLEYLITMNRYDGMSFKIGMENEYDSEDAGKNNDLKYYASILLDF